MTRLATRSTSSTDRYLYVLLTLWTGWDFERDAEADLLVAEVAGVVVPVGDVQVDRVVGYAVSQGLRRFAALAPETPKPPETPMTQKCPEIARRVGQHERTTPPEEVP